MPNEHDQDNSDDQIGQVAMDHNSLELLPPGKYAIIMFTRWSKDHYKDGSHPTVDDATYNLEWVEAVANNEAAIIPNLEPAQLPAAYEALMCAAEMGANIYGHQIETEDEMEVFDSLVGIHVIDMDVMVSVVAKEGDYVVH